MTAARLSTRFVTDGDETFEVLILEPVKPQTMIVFAVGAGGDPDRHLPFLYSLADHGCMIVAPRFARLLSSAPSADDLLVRIRRLQSTLAEVAPPNMRWVGIGHSIGATLLLMLAGAKASTLAGESVRVGREPRLKKLALLAPATKFFLAPGALENVHTPLAVWVGTNDEITPPTQGALLDKVLGKLIPVSVNIVPDAGHFSFMSILPPGAAESKFDRQTFLERLPEDIASFIMS